MLEVLLIVGVMVYIVWKLDSHHFEQVQALWREDAAPCGARRTPEPPPRPRLAIEGTQRPVIRDKKFVKGFGVNPLAVQDMRVYACMGRFDQFPESMQMFLHDLHDAGSAVGTGIMELLFHGRHLNVGEAVYFALVQSGPEPRVVTFLDRLRLS
jgi:hypothetical protein